MKNFLLYIALIAAIIGLLIFFFSTPNKQPSINQQATDSATMQPKSYSSPPPVIIDTKKTYTAAVTTSKGPITLELFASDVPNTVNNFVFLAKEGFYNGTTFHRIVKDFMIQGGDSNGNGTGGPGYKFPDEEITRDYTRGTIAMANSGPNTNGSQFFIMHKDYDLPKNYVIFGKVLEGIETVDKIAEIPTTEGSSGEKSSPTEKVTIESITISEK